VLDDSPTDAHRVHQSLASDYDLTLFSDGATTLERLSQGSFPDVLLVDWVMPGLTGPEVCRAIRAMPGPSRNIGIILLTGSRAASEVAEALESGANDFVAKPFDAPELRARVAALMRTRALIGQLERSEQIVRELLAKSPDALVAVDDQSRVVFANESAAALIGTSVEQLLGRRMQELLPDYADYAGLTPDDRPVPMPDVAMGDRLLAPTIRRFGDGGRFAAIVSVRDVTESRRQQARRLDFYSIVAHDLRAPLNTIQLRCALIGRGKHGILPAALLADIQKINGGVQSMISLINDFLDLARLESAGLKLDLKKLRVSEIVKSAVDEIRPLADASDMELRFEAPQPDAETAVCADRDRVVQVLSNLLSNAIKFTGSGGKVEVLLNSHAKDVEVGVKDNGPGIPPDAIPTLFDRFTRVEHTRSKVAGSGLGLMIVRQIVEAHGGKVRVDSRLGEGSTFWFSLPAAPA
jgi:signal transduction histidine kinase